MKTIKTMTAYVIDVELTHSDGTTLETRVGLYDGEWNDGMLNTDLDSSVYFWFDTIADVEVGAEVGDGTIITKVFGDFYQVSEEYESVDDDCEVCQQMRDSEEFAGTEIRNYHNSKLTLQDFPKRKQEILLEILNNSQ